MCDEFVMRQVEQKAKNKAGKYEGEYKVIIHNNKIAVEGSDGLFKISAMSKCDPQDKFDVGEGFKVAMNRLVAKRDEIHVGDKVKLITDDIYPLYSMWVFKNVDSDYKCHYAYGEMSAPMRDTYRVLVIKEHLSTDKMLAYIENMDGSKCYLVNLDNLEKVN